MALVERVSVLLLLLLLSLVGYQSRAWMIPIYHEVHLHGTRKKKRVGGHVKGVDG